MHACYREKNEERKKEDEEETDQCRPRNISARKSRPRGSYEDRVVHVYEAGTGMNGKTIYVCKWLEIAALLMNPMQRRA